MKTRQITFQIRRNALQQILAPVLILMVAAGTRSLEAQGVPCSQAAFIELNQALEVQRDAWRSQDLFRLEIPTEGVLVVEASALVGNFIQPRIDLLFEESSDGGTDDLTFVDRTPVRLLAKVHRAGSYCVAVRVAPGSPRGSYTLRVGFSPIPVAVEKAETRCSDPITCPGDPESSASPVRTTRPGKGEARFLIGETGVLELTGVGILLHLTPGLYRFGFVSLEGREEDVRFYPLCALDSGWQAGSLTCARGIEPGTVVRGEVDDRFGTDLDVFGFTLIRRRTVILGTRGTTDTLGELYDALGALLVSDDDGGRRRQLPDRHDAGARTLLPQGRRSGRFPRPVRSGDRCRRPAMIEADSKGEIHPKNQRARTG